jgi:hypothetical protein
MMLDLFRPLSPDARKEKRAAYQRFLLDRDGRLDRETRTLSRREQGMARYTKPLSRVREIDRRTFDAQYSAFDASLPTSLETLLLLALVKVNAAEAYGVNQTFDKALREAAKHGDDLELTLLVEETYHTRILLSSAVPYGIEVDAPYEPPAGLRALVGAIAHFPETMARPLTLAGEILGTLLFLELLRKTRSVLSHDPELRDSIEERICEIMVDEIGHVAYNRMLLGRAGLAQTRVVLPLVALSLARAVPELGPLGVEAAAAPSALSCLTTGRGLPEHVRSAAFLA